jgi:hypothetical protein
VFLVGDKLNSTLLLTVSMHILSQFSDSNPDGMINKIISSDNEFSISDILYKSF